MFLKNLELFRFRNLCDQRIEFESRLTIIVGKNGHGKTSVLEGVHLLSHAKSFRTNSAKELIRWNEKDICRVQGVVETVIGSREVCYRLKHGKKQVLVNGSQVTAAEEFYGNVRSISFIPNDLAMVSGEPAIRRRFVDRTLSIIDPVYVQELVSYQRALKARSVLLREQSTHLRPWETLLIRHGAEVTRRRATFISELGDHFREYYAYFSGEEGATRLSLKSRFLAKSEGELLELFEGHRQVDIKLGQTSLGPHRDDLKIEFSPDDQGFRRARGFASQGQSRSLALALKFAAVSVVRSRTSESPILLLDDVESELDSSRRHALYRLLAQCDAQVFLTSTEIPEESNTYIDDRIVYRVDKGSLERV